jgi:hypothetical protein
MVERMTRIALALCLIAMPVQADTARWQLMQCDPECKARGKQLSSATACALDLASLTNVVPSGTRVSCLKINGASHATK